MWTCSHQEITLFGEATGEHPHAPPRRLSTLRVSRMFPEFAKNFLPALLKLHVHFDTSRIWTAGFGPCFHSPRHILGVTLFFRPPQISMLKVTLFSDHIFLGVSLLLKPQPYVFSFLVFSKQPPRRVCGLRKPRVREAVALSEDPPGARLRELFFLAFCPAKYHCRQFATGACNCL